MAVGTVRGPLFEEPVVESLDDRLWSEQFDARCCKFDRQREPVEVLGQLCDRSRIVSRQVELGPDRAGAVHEELNGLAVGDRLDVDGAFVDGCGQRLYWQFVFALNVERRP